MSTRSQARRDRAAAARVRLLASAERLFAERGLSAVSHRQIAEAAGQANNSAVAYHIGSRRELITAIVRAHCEPMDRQRDAMISAAAGSDEIRDHIACLVRPLTDHLAELGVPSYYARFAAHVTTDPGLRELVLGDVTASPAMRRALDGLLSRLPDLPAAVAMVRSEMVRHILVHTCAERERALAENRVTATASWAATDDALIDAIAGLVAAEMQE